jgi:tetratricopeptide (TPR) repeat protein
MELGNCYRRLNQAADATRANRRGVELAEAEMARNPRDGYARSHLAYLCARLGDRRRAESEIAQALQLSPNGADTRGLAAFTYEALGMRDATLAVLSAAPVEVVKDLSRWPDVADLHKDPRFLQLLASNQRR